MDKDKRNSYQVVDDAFGKMESITNSPEIVYENGIIISPDYLAGMTKAELHECMSTPDMPDAKDLTCYDCLSRKECEYTDDGYNTDGDCLAIK